MVKVAVFTVQKQVSFNFQTKLAAKIYGEKSFGQKL